MFLLYALGFIAAIIIYTRYGPRKVCPDTQAYPVCELAQ